MSHNGSSVVVFHAGVRYFHYVFVKLAPVSSAGLKIRQEYLLENYQRGLFVFDLPFHFLALFKGLILEFVTRVSASVASGASSLDHKIFDNSVKDQSVIERSFCFSSGERICPFFCSVRKPDKISYRNRRDIRPEFNFYCSEACFKYCYRFYTGEFGNFFRSGN